jgi:hypothetical protein
MDIRHSHIGTVTNVNLLASFKASSDLLDKLSGNVVLNHGTDVH